MTRTKVRVLTLVAAAALGAMSLTYFRREVLSTLGNFLLVATPLASTGPADLLVVIRGDETRFERALTTATLFKDGRANGIYVSSALNDEDVETLGRYGISLPTPQRNIATVLTARNVPCEKISLDRNAPGGGTVGEAHRVARFMAKHDLHSAIAVTSWYHTRRTKLILTDALEKLGINISVVAADSDIGPQNWWEHRYVAITVLEELFKYLIQRSTHAINFSDDPTKDGLNETEHSVSACDSLNHH